MTGPVGNRARRLLLVEDDPNGRLVLGALLEDAGFQVREAGSLAEAREAIGSGGFEIAVVDVELPDGRGPELLGELSRSNPGIALAVMSGHGDLEVPLAHVCLTKAAATSQLLEQLEVALASAREERE